MGKSKRLASIWWDITNQVNVPARVRDGLEDLSTMPFDSVSTQTGDGPLPTPTLGPRTIDG